MSIIKSLVKAAVRTPINFVSGVVIGTHVTPRLYAATIDAAPADAGVVEKGARAAAFLVANTAVILGTTYLTIKVVDLVFGD